MYNDHKLVLGVAPTRRRMYQAEDALENKRLIYDKIKEIADKSIEIVDMEWLNEEGLLIDVGDVAKVAAHFKAKSVNALFMPHCNYGTEEVVAMLGKSMGVPFLLYGPRDAAPPSEGGRIRQTDTQCGLFPSSKALQRYGVTFTYIENCPIDSKTFAEGFDLFTRAALVVKKTRGMRVGVMNARPKPFLCVIYNEAEILEKFGIEVVPLNALDILGRMDEFIANHPDDVRAVKEDLSKQMDTGPAREGALEKVAALRLTMLEAAQKHDLEAVGSECWTLFPKAMGFTPCAAFGDITNCGLPMGCETDVMCSVTMAMLSAASRGKNKPFCADLTVRHPTDDNTELLWHCGPFPVGGARPESKPSMTGSVGWWEMAHGDMTIARLDSLNGKYSLLSGEGAAVDGPPTNGTYSWFKVDNWPKWEREIMYGPYIHHVAGMHGHWSDVFEEVCRYLGIGIDRLG
ncbi:MAG: fucose isomerase [Oscillospiraceae bacterium]|nr:fucose isomerase [Oscillospiraceae bacterium]